jgi:hypothetical protein
VPELGPLGSVRGASSNGRPYREHIQMDIQRRFAHKTGMGFCASDGFRSIFLRDR